MKIEYEQPWFLNPKIGQSSSNVIMNSSYTISLSFFIDENYKKDDKVGFFGVPGKNFGVSYDCTKAIITF